MSNQDRAEGKNIPHFHGDDGSLAVNAMRTEFEHWYVTESFDYPSNPLGSRQCDLQWRAWRAARSATPQAPGADTPGGRGEAVVVQRNSCTCHPETCCCREYGLLVGFEVVATGDREGMEKLASLIRSNSAESSGGDA